MPSEDLILQILKYSLFSPKIVPPHPENQIRVIFREAFTQFDNEKKKSMEEDTISFQIIHVKQGSKSNALSVILSKIQFPTSLCFTKSIDLAMKFCQSSEELSIFSHIAYVSFN